MLTDNIDLVTCVGDLIARKFQPLGDVQLLGLLDNHSNPLGISRPQVDLGWKF